MMWLGGLLGKNLRQLSDLVAALDPAERAPLSCRICRASGHRFGIFMHVGWSSDWMQVAGQRISPNR